MIKGLCIPMYFIRLPVYSISIIISRNDIGTPNKKNSSLFSVYLSCHDCKNVYDALRLEYSNIIPYRRLSMPSLFVSVTHFIDVSSRTVELGN